MADKGLFFPTTIFFLFITGTILLAAVFHLQEFMYMLLMIYAICNLHVVSWGTREVKQTPTEKKIEDEMKAEVEQKKKGNKMKKMAGIISMGSGDEEKDGCTMSCGTCCSYICCPHKVNQDERGVELKLLLAKIDKIEYMLQNTNNNQAAN